MVHLRRQHKGDPLSGQRRVQMDDALNILYGVAVAVTVALSAVHQRRGAAPHHGGKALEGVPGVNHGVKTLVRRVHGQRGELTVPVSFQGGKFDLRHFAGVVAVMVQQRACFGFIFLPKQEDQRAFFTGPERHRRVQCAAGIAVVTFAVVATTGQQRLRGVKTGTP